MSPLSTATPPGVFMSLLCSNTYDANNIPSQGDLLCITNDNYSSVKYVEIDTGGLTTGISMNIKANGNNYTVGYNNVYNKNYYLQGFSSITSLFSWYSFTNYGNAPSGWYVKVNFYDSMPGAATGTINISDNGTFDVSNYSTAVVSVPQTTVVSDITPYSDLVVDSFWQYHTAFAGSVVALIAIFLVYRLLKGRLR